MVMKCVKWRQKKHVTFCVWNCVFKFKHATKLSLCQIWFTDVSGSSLKKLAGLCKMKFHWFCSRSYFFLADTDTTFNTYFEIEYLLLWWRLMRLDMSVCIGTGPRGQVNPSGHMWHKVGKVTSVSAVVGTWGSRLSPNIGDPLPFIIPHNNPFITTSMLCVNLNYPSNSTWPSF